MFSEFDKLKDRRCSNKTVGNCVLQKPDPEQWKGMSDEKLKKGDNEADSWSQKIPVNVVPTPKLLDSKLHAASLEIQAAESEEQENDDDDLDRVAKSDEASKDEDVGANSGSRISTPSEPNKSPMGLAVVEMEQNHAATVELPPPKPLDTDQPATVCPNQNHRSQPPVPPPEPPDPPDFDPFLAVTKDLEVASEIEIEEEERSKEGGSGISRGSWVNRDSDGWNLSGRPGMFSSGSLSETRPKLNTVYSQGSNLKPASSSARLSFDGKKNQGEDRYRGIKHLPYHELMERKAKGLCVRCGDKFHPFNQCPEKRLRLLILGNDEDANEGEVLAIEVDKAIAEEEESLDCKVMDLCGITWGSIEEAKAMKVEGRLKGVPVLVLIDSGAAHNFISSQVAAALGLPAASTKELSV